MEGDHDVAKNASASTSRGRAHLTGQVDCKDSKHFNREIGTCCWKPAECAIAELPSPGTDPAEGMKMRSSSGPSERKV